MKKSVQRIDSNSASFLKNKTGKEAVLCMDGGGIRGLVLTELLFALEEVTGQPVSQLFDWVSGTSTGSYLALAVATGKPSFILPVFVTFSHKTDKDFTVLAQNNMATFSFYKLFPPLC